MKKVIPILSRARQCHNCGNVHSFRAMKYLGEKWFCDTNCYRAYAAKKERINANTLGSTTDSLGDDSSR